MSKHAIILYYEGTNPPQALISHIVEHVIGACDAEANSIVVKHYDEDSIVKAVGDDAIRRIVGELKEEYKRPTVKIHIQEGKKTAVVKFVKDLFGISLPRAKEMVDKCILEIPACINTQSLITGLYTSGATICKGSDYAVEQASFFIKKTYGDPLTLVRAYAVAGYHNRVNAADEEELALLNAIDILCDNPREASLQLSDDTLFQTILALKR